MARRCHFWRSICKTLTNTKHHTQTLLIMQRYKYKTSVTFTRTCNFARLNSSCRPTSLLSILRKLASILRPRQQTTKFGINLGNLHIPFRHRKTGYWHVGGCFWLPCRRQTLMWRSGRRTGRPRSRKHAQTDRRKGLRRCSSTCRRCGSRWVLVMHRCMLLVARL